MDSSFVIPLTFWNSSQPSFRISSICLTPNLKKVVTGSFSGQLCLWDLDIKNKNLTPKNILIGHKNTVTCMACTNEYVISSCENKQIFRWNMDDGYCFKTNQTSYIHRKMALFRRPHCEEYVFACGDYSEIFIIHSFTLQIIFILHSSTNLDWISNFQIKFSETKGNLVLGITENGSAKFWIIDEFTNKSLFELKSEVIPMTEIVDLKYNSSQTKLLIVSVNYFSIYDSEISTCLCKIEVPNEKLLGGKFYENDLIVWTRSGKIYFYDVSEKENLISVILDKYTHSSVFEPACDFEQADVEKYFIKGDFWGKLSIWKINEQEKRLEPLFCSSLAEKWVTDAFFNSYVKFSEITCCIYVLQLDKFFIGCQNGSIVSIPATQSIMSFYFHSSDVCSDIFIGHSGKVNCLLYPHDKYSHFNKSHLVSGSSDFSVCLWDVYKVELLYKFCVQSGEILQLLVPPENFNAKVKFSVCSVSLDNSVAILNLKDQRCIILTSRHTFPVVGVHWRPLDDFIIIECFDGTVYVWQIETGHLDRVIDGIVAQEILYACNEYYTTSLYNFYVNEQHFIDNFFTQLYNEDENVKNMFMLRKFFIGNSENHIFLFDLVPLLTEINYIIESGALGCSFYPESHLLTEAGSMELQKRIYLEKLTKNCDIVQVCDFSSNNNFNVHSEKNKAAQNKVKYLNDFIKEKIKVFLAAIHIWGLSSSVDEILISKLKFCQPLKIVSFGILSQPGIFSLFLPISSISWQKNSSFVTSFCVSVLALTKVMKYNSFECEKIDEKVCWEELNCFYEKLFTNREIISKMKIEVLCKLLKINCLPIHKIAYNFLNKHLQVLSPKENADLLQFWYKYLPHFKILDKTLPEKVDFENKELKTVALVLFGIFGSDFKFKTSDLTAKENYAYQTCASFVYLLLLPNSQIPQFSHLQTIAIDFIGRGYIVWESFLKMENIVPILLKVCANSTKEFASAESSKGVITSAHMYLSAQNALKSIAIARTAAFINCLVNEVNNIKLGRGDENTIENSKTEILSVLSYLLEKTPYFMLLHLGDVISLIVSCIDFSHLKQENLSRLFPALQKFRQIHHSVSSQRIAVGLATGSLVFYDLRTGKAVEVPAHKDSVSALKFSEDGKFLVSYSFYENRLLCWRILTGMFGLGQFHVKCTKSCQTYQIHDEEIRNHLEIASLTWTDKKSVLLSLCDGSENIFEF